MPYRYNQIEAKHFYIASKLANSLSIINGMYDTGAVKPVRLSFITQGTDENERVGNKIANVQLRLEYSINLYDYLWTLVRSQLTTAVDPLFFMKFRVMLIDLPIYSGNMTAQEATTYFNNMFTYIDDSVVTSSTHQMSLRVSGPVTGEFNILYDKMLTISTSKPFLHKCINIKLANQLKFEAGGEIQPENHNYFLWFIMPKYYLEDVSTALRDQIMEIGHTVGVQFVYNMKITYNDN